MASETKIIPAPGYALLQRVDLHDGFEHFAEFADDHLMRPLWAKVIAIGPQAPKGALYGPHEVPYTPEPRPWQNFWRRMVIAWSEVPASKPPVKVGDVVNFNHLNNVKNAHSPQIAQIDDQFLCPFGDIRAKMIQLPQTDFEIDMGWEPLTEIVGVGDHICVSVDLSPEALHGLMLRRTRKEVWSKGVETTGLRQSKRQVLFEPYAACPIQVSILGPSLAQSVWAVKKKEIVAYGT